MWPIWALPDCEVAMPYPHHPPKFLPNRLSEKNTFHPPGMDLSADIEFIFRFSSFCRSVGIPALQILSGASEQAAGIHMLWHQIFHIISEEVG